MAGQKVALVTGAAVGLGRAISLALAGQGYALALADKDEAGVRAVQAELAGEGRPAFAIGMDLRSEDGIEQGFAAAARHFGHVDALVNNAGITIHKPVLDLTWSDWDAVMSVNLKAAFFMSRAFGRHVIGRGGAGSIVNLGSAHGLVAMADRSAYAISKAGIMHMTKMLAVEWAKQGIRVNAVAPGTVMTPSRAALLSAPDVQQRMLARIPSGKFPTEAEVAAAVLYLMSDAAASVTGHSLVLDGGTTIA
jgi:2-deoxy-D-gluconate 3-dehydrogenase